MATNEELIELFFKDYYFDKIVWDLSKRIIKKCEVRINHGVTFTEYQLNNNDSWEIYGRKIDKNIPLLKRLALKRKILYLILQDRGAL